MTTEQLNKFLAEAGYQPTATQRRFIEAMGETGKRMGERLAAGIKDEIDATIRSRSAHRS